MADPEVIRVLGMKHTLFDNSLFLSEPFWSLKAHKWLKENYEPTDNEIWIVTYPKTGTTLTLQICHQIMECYYNKTKSKDDEYYKENNGEYTVFEWLTVMKTMGEKFNKFIENTTNTKRFWKTHCKLKYLPCKTLPKKMIIVCRNPKDALVSFYHHTINSKDKEYSDFRSSFDTYFTLWVAGLVENNSYFEYYQKYWDFYKRNMGNGKQTEILWLNYEDLIVNDASKRHEIRKLINFIGVENIVNTREDIDRIIYGSSVKKMKKQYENSNIQNFVRKGKISDWKNYFTNEQNEIMNALIKVYFNNTDFKYYKDLVKKCDYLVRSRL